MRLLTSTGLYALLSTFIIFVSAVNNLGFQLDQSAADKGYFLFSTILPLNEATIEDETLLGLARDAIVFMKAEWSAALIEWKNRHPDKEFRRPKAKANVVVAFWIKDRIYISSSMKTTALAPFRMKLQASNSQGSRSVNSFLDKTCERCSMTVTPSTDEDGTVQVPEKKYHQNMGSCGEIMALHQWDLANGGQLPMDTALQGARIVAVSKALDEDTVLRPPCDADVTIGGYGCQQVLDLAGIKAIDVNTQFPATTRDVRFAPPMQKSVICSDLIVPIVPSTPKAKL